MKKLLIVSFILCFCLLSVSIVAYARFIGDDREIPCGNIGGGDIDEGCTPCNFKVCEKINGWASYTLTGKCVTEYGCVGGCNGRWKDTTVAGKDAGLNECKSDSECVTECSRSGETNPHTECDSKTNKCTAVYKCGKSTCSGVDKCCGGATNPYYVCSSTVPGACEPKYSCGISICNYKDDIKTSCLSYLYDDFRNPYCASYKNAKCTSYYCGQVQRPIWNGSRYVFQWDKGCVERLGTPLAGYFSEYLECSKTCLSVIPTTTTSSTIKNIGSPIDKVTTTSTKETKPVTYSCDIVDFNWASYKKGSSLIFTRYDNYSLFVRPEDEILSNPKLEYTANECSDCRIDIVPTDKSLAPLEFIKDNPDVFGKQEPTEEIAENRFVFNKSAFNQAGMILNIANLYTGKYKLTLTCNDPDTGDVQTTSVKFNLYPYIRWRETMPVINDNR